MLEERNMKEQDLSKQIMVDGLNEEEQDVIQEVSSAEIIVNRFKR